MKSASWGLSLLLAGTAYCVPVTTGHTAGELASTMVGSGITISNAVYTGAPASNGIYTGSTAEAQGNANLTNGIVLSSGNAGFLANGANTTDGITLNTGGGGDANLQALIPSFTLFDAAALDFDFVAAGAGLTTVSFWYVFGSEEYNEYVGNVFNDVFGFFLNGTNVALLPGTTTPVAINNVNNGLNAGSFVNNDPTDILAGTLTPKATEMDGYTVPLFVQFQVQAGQTNHLKLAIADAGDHILDSWVMIGGGSFNNTPAIPGPGPELPPEAVPEPGTLAMIGMGLIGLAFAARRRNRGVE
jgi:hypothetical protein